jgi:hypothetical protein
MNYTELRQEATRMTRDFGQEDQTRETAWNQVCRLLDCGYANQADEKLIIESREQFINSILENL